ncbi:MAG: thioredoxin family protein, partial [Granulosicoccaceae bacterium]
MAIWMLERVLPAPAILALTAMLLIVSAVYMGALEKPAEGKSGWYQLWRGIGLVFLIYGALLMVGAASGGKSLLKPLAGVGLSAGGSTASAELHFTQVDNNVQLNAAIASANAQGKKVMFDFYADWCTSCKEMEAFTFTDPQVQAALGDFVTLQVDVTDNNEEHQAMLKRFGLFGPPAILFFGLDGQEQRNLRVVGFMRAEPFAANVRGVM